MIDDDLLGDKIYQVLSTKDKNTRDFIDTLVMAASFYPVFSFFRDEMLILIEAGWCEPSDERASLFLSTGLDEAITVGKTVFECGGIDHMRIVHGMVENYFPRYAARELEAAWNGIGTWRA